MNHVLVAALKQMIAGKGKVLDSGYGWELRSYKETLYHGSPTPVQSFDPAKGDGRFGKGLYLINDIDWADFYARGGRQGKAGQRENEEPGHIYRFMIQTPKAIFVTDDEEWNSEIGEYVHEAEDLDPWSAKIQTYGVEFADNFNADVLVFDPKNTDVHTPVAQTVVLNKSAIKYSEEMSPEEVKEKLGKR